MFDNDYTKTCPSCHEEFYAKRTNQVYCTQQCKSKYHNGFARYERQALMSRKAITKEMDEILWKNREILNQHRGEEIYLQELEDEGFKTNFITSFAPMEEDEEKTEFTIYDITYYFVDIGILKIM